MRAPPAASANRNPLRSSSKGSMTTSTASSPLRLPSRAFSTARTGPVSSQRTAR